LQRQPVVPQEPYFHGRAQPCSFSPLPKPRHQTGGYGPLPSLGGPPCSCTHAALGQTQLRHYRCMPSSQLLPASACYVDFRDPSGPWTLHVHGGYLNTFLTADGYVRLPRCAMLKEDVGGLAIVVVGSRLKTRRGRQGRAHLWPSPYTFRRARPKRDSLTQIYELVPGLRPWQQTLNRHCPYCSCAGPSTVDERRTAFTRNGCW